MSNSWTTAPNRCSLRQSNRIDFDPKRHTTMDGAAPIALLHPASSQGFYGIDRVILTLAKYIDRRSFDFRVANIEESGFQAQQLRQPRDPQV
jgi:hypothetical protein